MFFHNFLVFVLSCAGLPQEYQKIGRVRYEDVKMNAEIIYGMISTQSMPPPPFPPYTADQIDLFKQWMDAGCPA